MYIEILLTRAWSIEETEQLIEELKRYPCLYNKSSKDWKNVSLKNSAKGAIASIFVSCGKSATYSIQHQYTFTLDVGDVDAKLAKLKT